MGTAGGKGSMKNGEKNVYRVEKDSIGTKESLRAAENFLKYAPGIYQQSGLH